MLSRLLYAVGHFAEDILFEVLFPEGTSRSIILLYCFNMQ